MCDAYNSGESGGSRDSFPPLVVFSPDPGPATVCLKCLQFKNNCSVIVLNRTRKIKDALPALPGWLTSWRLAYVTVELQDGFECRGCIGFFPVFCVLSCLYYDRFSDQLAKLIFRGAGRRCSRMINVSGEDDGSS